MLKYVITIALAFFYSVASYALSLENSDIRLFCPIRGQIEIILHRYEHSQESWGVNQFETGAGHFRKGPFLIFQFANLDQMVFNQTTGQFSFWYSDREKLVGCRLIRLTNTYPVDISYFRE
ncbi:hypothetical protein [Enterobacter quasiroggenkampii]|uniref:hypothetical protein n=1 Tax=Enterobacter quasiroggenkampii TaxID=2497436 RepID=UPI0030B95257